MATLIEPVAEADNRSLNPDLVKKILHFWLYPALLFFGFFVLYTWPVLTRFSTAFFADAGDGLQNVWNIWWVNKSITEMHQLPYDTYFVDFPHGITMLGQTLNPFNGLIAIPLLRFLSLVQVHNVIVLFSFVFGGMTMMWLAYFLSKNYWASFLAGFFFTFSSYHFAHGIGHLQLVSLEFIPLFILFWWQFLLRPGLGRAVSTAIALGLVLLCDHYYFVYSVLVATGIFVHLVGFKREISWKNPRLWGWIAVFCALVLATSGQLFLALLHLNRVDPLTGSHDSSIFGLDLLSPFVYTNIWRWGDLTKWFWDRPTFPTVELSTYLGLATILVLIFGFFKRRLINPDGRFWQWVLVIFGVLALGPYLKINGHLHTQIRLPYRLLEKLVPAIQISGVPSRMMIMAIFAAAVLIATTLPVILQRYRFGKLIVAVFAIVLFFDLFPGPYAYTAATTPGYIQALEQLPPGAIIDDASTASFALYYQTIHQRPMAFGYVSRRPTSVVIKDLALKDVVARDDWTSVCRDYKLRYYLQKPGGRVIDSLQPVYADSFTEIYDLHQLTGCQSVVF